jgi:TolA-binding protein
MDLDELKSLAKQLPEHQPTEDRTHQLRDSLLTAVNKEQIRKPLFSPWLAAGAIAVAAAVAFYAGTRSAETTAASDEKSALVASPALTSPDGARFDRKISQSDVGEIEEVHLHGGSLQISAEAAQRPLRVVTKNASVRGVSSFTVEASDDELRAVYVRSGRLEVRIENQPPIVLGPGESWIEPEQQHIELAVRTGTKPIEEEVAPVVETQADGEAPHDEALHNESSRDESSRDETPHDKSSTDEALRDEAQRDETPRDEPKREAQAVTDIVKRAHPIATHKQETVEPSVDSDVDTTPSETPAELPAETPRKPSATELAFDAGYRAVKRGDYAQGLLQLELALRETGDADLRADARYWRIVALARSGRKTLAQGAMQEFMQKHPRNSRGGEVATMLGWMYVEQGKAELAKPLFEVGNTDASARVRTSAQAGLKTIAK